MDSPLSNSFLPTFRPGKIFNNNLIGNLIYLIIVDSEITVIVG